MNYYDEIKNRLISNEVYKRVKDYSKNRNDLDTYYNVGKLLYEAGKHYGERIIDEYSKRLTMELGKGYSKRNLWLMLSFYEFQEKVQTMSAQLSWSHYVELLSIDNIDEVKYYIKITEENNLSIRELRNRIKSKEYERLPITTRNKLISNDSLEVQDLIKNPIIIKNTSNIEIIKETVLKQLIIEDLDSFLSELGDGFCYIANEYKILIGNRYNYIDLLLFNIEYNCYVVIELKVTELKKEHIGQIEIYMNYINDNLRKDNMNKTIGIIICKQDNKYVIKYCSDKRIIARKYVII